jgi:hypothetical protein
MEEGFDEGVVTDFARALSEGMLPATQQRSRSLDSSRRFAIAS